MELPMGGLWPAILVFLLVGGIATAWVVLVKRPKEESRIGLREMSALRWREFQRLVVAMLEARGFKRVAATESDDSNDQGLLALQRGDETWLLLTHHSAGYVPDGESIKTLADIVNLRGASGAWITSPSTLDPALVNQASSQKIELLDWPTLWSEIRPLLDHGQLAGITETVRAQTNRQVLLSWGAAAVAGALAYLLLGGSADPSAVTATPVSTPRPAPATAGAAAPGKPAKTATPAADDEIPEDPKQLAERRRRMTQTIGTLPWVDRAVWSTQSTLVVYLSGDLHADRDELCRLVEGYAELRTSRLQLQPPPESERNVRFIQCRTY